MVPKPANQALRAWDALCEDFAGGEGAEADWIDPLAPDEWMRTFSFTASVATPRTLLYFTKSQPLSWLVTDWKEALPAKVEVIVHWGLVVDHQADRVRREASRCGRRIRFLGDLDPQDLATYLSLAFGGHRMRPRKSAVPIVYAGINDAWLGAAESATKIQPQSFLDTGSIEMTDAEKRYLRVVEQLAPQLETWVGPRCAALLRSGRKIEMEAVLNPEIFRLGYIALLRKLLTGEDERPRYPPRGQKR
jgi:hypothetical protein